MDEEINNTWHTEFTTMKYFRDKNISNCTAINYKRVNEAEEWGSKTTDYGTGVLCFRMESSQLWLIIAKTIEEHELFEEQYSHCIVYLYHVIVQIFE